MEELLEKGRRLITVALKPKVEVETPVAARAIKSEITMTTEMNLEEITEEIEILLRRCSVDELKSVAVELEITGAEEKSRRQTLRLIEDAIGDIGDEKERFRAMRDLDLPERLKEKQENLFRTRTSARKESVAEEKAVEIPGNFYIHVVGKDKNVRVEIGPQRHVLKEEEEVVIGPSEMIEVPTGQYCVIENPVKLDENQRVVFKDGTAVLRIGEVEIRQNQDPFPLYSGESLKVKPRPILEVEERPTMDSLFGTMLDGEQMAQGIDNVVQARVKEELKKGKFITQLHWKILSVNWQMARIARSEEN